MVKESNVNKAFEVAAERYAALGVDVNKALEEIKKISLSLHCWQTDDVTGFENQGGSLTGGIQVTGNYPGRARNMEEVRADILKAKSYIPGSHRLSLHEIYGDFQGKKVDRDEVEPCHFQTWMEWAKENGMKLDFNSTSFSHPKSGDLTLANPDDSIRNFWIEHTKRCRWISEEMGKFQNDPCMLNIWIHDGSKEIPASRLKYAPRSVSSFSAAKYRSPSCGYFSRSKESFSSKYARSAAYSLCKSALSKWLRKYSSGLCSPKDSSFSCNSAIFFSAAASSFSAADLSATAALYSEASVSRSFFASASSPISAPAAFSTARFAMMSASALS